MPKADDTARVSVLSPLGLPTNWQQAGASKTWDFSKLDPVGTQLREYKASFRTPYAFYFFNQIGEKIADTLGGGPLVFTNVHNFYTKSTSVFKAEGIGYTATGIPLAAKYTDDDEIYQFPLEYNDSDVSTFRFKFEIPGQQLITYIQQGKRTNVVDAYGSIKTPYKTYTDVIRVKTIMNQVDTLVSPLGKTAIPRPQVIYKWLSQDEIIPVMEIRGTVAFNGTFTVTEVYYRDSFRGLPTGGGGGNPGTFVVDFSVNKNTGLAGSDVFEFTNKTQPMVRSYNWKFIPSSGVRFVNGTSATSANPQVVFDEAGSYTVNLSAQAGPGFSRDTTYSDLIQIEWGAFTHKLDIQNCLLVYPVPSNDRLNLRFTCPTLLPVKYPASLTVVNTLGKAFEIKQVCDSDALCYYRIQDLPTGLYKLGFMGHSIHFVKM